MCWASRRTRLMEQGVIEVAPLAFMRGRTLDARLCDSGRSAEHHPGADEDGADPAGRRCADGGDRRSVAKRPAGRRARKGLNEALAILNGVEGVAVARFSRCRCGAPRPRQRASSRLYAKPKPRLGCRSCPTAGARARHEFAQDRRGRRRSRLAQGAAGLRPVLGVQRQPPSCRQVRNPPSRSPCF